MSPRVSIITPAFNAARWLPQTLASVQAQSFADWEMVIADDCSGDSTVELVEAASAADPRIRLVRLAHNQGAAAARNSALDAARGRYVAMLDSDDLWLPEKLHRQIGFMERGGLAFTYTSYRWMSEDGRRVGEPVWVPPSLSYTDLLRRTGAIPTLTVVIDRSQVGEIHLPTHHAEDMLLWYELLKKTRAYGLGEDLARYRLSNQSLSRNKLRHAQWVWENFRRLGLSPGEAARCFVGYARHGVEKTLAWKKTEWLGPSGQPPGWLGEEGAPPETA